MKKPFRLNTSDASTRDVHRDVHREIELHLELRAREFEALGMSADEARRAALNAFGDRSEIESEVNSLRETTVKERRRRDWLAELRQDITVGLRGLRRAPAFTLVALLTLGIGIGANTAIFSVLRSVLLRPLPYANPEQLVQVWTDHRALGRAEPEWLTPPDFEDWKKQNRSFSGMAAYSGWGAELTGRGEPESLTAMAVSGNYFGVLGTKASIGRLLADYDDAEAAAPVVVITQGLWKRRFGGDSTIIGKQLTLSGNPWTVVGVLPESFRTPAQTSPEVFRPFRRPSGGTCGRGCYVLRVIGRLKPNTSISAAHADLSTIAAQQARDFPQTNSKVGVWLVPLHEQLTGESKNALFALTGAVAFVLLIACVNLANLLLVRGAARARELGVRAALGAGQGRLVRQLITENAMLTIAGGGIGILLGVIGSRVLASMTPESIRRVQDIRVDLSVVVFAILITAISSLIFGVLPALQSARANLMTSLRSGSRETSRRSGALRSGLVIAQLSLAVVLLVGAGLLGKSFLRLQQVDLGYRNSGVAFAPVNFPSARYNRRSSAQSIELLVAQLRGNPAIRKVEATDIFPLGQGDQDMNVIALGEPVRENRPPSIWTRSVTPGYLPLMQMRLIAGRQLNEQDRTGPLVGIINEEAARAYFPGSEALGRILLTGDDPKAERITIVGIVASARHSGPNQPYKSELFLPWLPRFLGGSVLVIEPAQSASAAREALRVALNALDPLIPTPTLQPIEERLGTAVALPRLYAGLVGAFAGVALLLAVLGVYGVMAYTVSQRQREIGVRLALGANPSKILGMVLKQGGKLAAMGVAVGTVVALLLGRLLTALLFGVSAFDAPTLIAVPLVLAVMTLVASWVPARRAMRVDPLVAIRED